MGLVDSILQGVEGPDADFGGADSPDHLASDLCSFESFLQISSHSAVHWHQYIYIHHFYHLAGLLQSWNSKSQRPEASGMAWNSKSEFRLRPLLSLRGELSRCCRQAWNTTGCVHLNHPFPNAYD